MNLACGYPVALSDRAGLIEAFAGQLQAVVDEPRQLLAKRDAGIRRVRQWFTWPRKARQVLKVYQWVLGGRDERPCFDQIVTRQHDEPAGRAVEPAVDVAALA